MKKERERYNLKGTLPSNRENDANLHFFVSVDSLVTLSIYKAESARQK